MNMQTVSIDHVHEKLRRLSAEKMNMVYGFLLLLEEGNSLKFDTLEGMLLSESLLRRELSNPEEDAAWADL